MRSPASQQVLRGPAMTRRPRVHRRVHTRARPPAVPMAPHEAWLYATHTASPFGPDDLSGPHCSAAPTGRQGPWWHMSGLPGRTYARMRCESPPAHLPALPLPRPGASPRYATVTPCVTACMPHAFAEPLSYAAQVCGHLGECPFAPRVHPFAPECAPWPPAMPSHTFTGAGRELPDSESRVDEDSTKRPVRVRQPSSVQVRGSPKESWKKFLRTT
ncbi:hypothetical protein GCM10023237_05770 [Streptomyces coeruleoprunus]